jgi:hypothetical protein
MEAKLNRLTHKIAIQLHLVAESCTICSFRSGRPVRKLLDTPTWFYTFLTSRYMGVSGQLHAPAAFSLGKDPRTPTVRKLCGTIRGVWQEKKILVCRESKAGRPARSLVTISTELPRLPTGVLQPVNRITYDRNSIFQKYLKI